MKKVISASRRTDLVAFFPESLSKMLREERTDVLGPSGFTYFVDLSPASVHTIVLWSKNFKNLLVNRFQLADMLKKFDQLYLHFTVTGMGGTFIERGVSPPEESLEQLEGLLEIAGRPERISIRFDPVVFWKSGGKTESNLDFFEKLAPRIASLGINTVRFSFAQWYNKAKRRAAKMDFAYEDPDNEEKLACAAGLAGIASSWGLTLNSCSQRFLTEVPGIHPSACIDGEWLQSLHPSKETVSWKKDRTQRPECGCTESVEIGSYTQHCPHSCLYCYANPKI
jgi:hypothetical protein